MKDDLISRQAALNTEYIVKTINGVDYVMLSEVQMKLRKQPSAQPSYTDEQIQKMQELEQAEIEKAFQLGMEDAEPEIIRCKDCRWGREVFGNIECFTDTNVPPEYHGYEWFCPNGERRTDEIN